jgi:hypothetical protein
VNERRRPRAVLNADIIFSRVLHELMGRIAAELRLLDLFWSEQLLAEGRGRSSRRSISRLSPRNDGSTTRAWASRPGVSTSIHISLT